MKCPETARRLKEAMNDINITQQELAKRSGVSKSSICQYVNGSHSPSNISAGKMGKVLGVNPVWLMGFDAEKIKTITVVDFFAGDIHDKISDKVKASIRLSEYDAAETGKADAEIIMDERTISVARKFYQLKEEDKKAIEHMINALYGKRTED